MMCMRLRVFLVISCLACAGCPGGGQGGGQDTGTVSDTDGDVESPVDTGDEGDTAGRADGGSDEPDTGEGGDTESGSDTEEGSSEDASDGGMADGMAGEGVPVEECSNPAEGWIWCDDFEQDRRESYFEYKEADGSFVRTDGAGRDGSYGMEATFAEGQVGAGALHLAFGQTPSSYFEPVDAGDAKYREIYWRVYLRHESSWEGGGGHKFSRATVFANGDWAQAMIAHLWSGGEAPGHNYLVADPASGTDEAGNLQTTEYNDFDNLRWLGAERGKTPLFDGEHVGRWYCIEGHVRLNDPGQENGVFEFWIDGQRETRIEGMNWVGDYSDYGLNAVFLENYWNGGAPKEQSRAFDNFVVSRSRIGCGS